MYLIIGCNGSRPVTVSHMTWEQVFGSSRKVWLKADNTGPIDDTADIFSPPEDEPDRQPDGFGILMHHREGGTKTSRDLSLFIPKGVVEDSIYQFWPVWKVILIWYLYSY